MDAMETRILDAALESVAAGASTMDDIAARAGVGRVTLFRRFGSKDALLQRLYAREVERFLARVDTALSEFDDPADRIAEAFVACVREGARHPLLATVRPGTVLEVLTAGDPSPLEAGRRFVAARLSPARSLRRTSWSGSRSPTCWSRRRSSTRRRRAPSRAPTSRRSLQLPRRQHHALGE